VIRDGDGSALGPTLRQTFSRAIGAAWDKLPTHIELARLTAIRARFRIRRTLDRIRSPRRIIATTLAVVFFLFYLLNGIFILSAREAADPERLRLWLSGGMVLYAIYHCVRCAWSENVADLELTSPEELWLGGAPIKRSSLAVYHVGNMIVPAILKTLLLAVVLARDVAHLELLVVGMFTSLVLLEIVRLMIARWSAGLDGRGRGQFRIAITLVAAAVGMQVIAGILAITPMGSATWMYVLNGFRGLGQTAASDMIQWLSIPWIAAAHLTVTNHYQPLTLLQLFGAASVLPLAILLLVRVDAWSLAKQHEREQERLASGSFQNDSHREDFSAATSSQFRAWIDRRVPDRAADAVAVIARQWVSVRRYRGTIVFSFVVPTLLCLSPLFTGQANQQWLFVVGGIALCTMLLAPPALRIDFRRDLRRMLLLRSLPVKPMSMVLGQLTLPVLITCVYQWITIAVAAAVTQPGLSQLLLWTGMLNALAVLTFAAENALFLAYPHHERSEGVAMMVRAKLTFLGKATVIAISLGLLFAWATICRRLLPDPWVEPTLVMGAVASTWIVAAVSVLATTSCWRRFDLDCDMPPQ
jgi:hypothetical protein